MPIVFLAAPSLTHLPARLIAGCSKWIALAGVLELASILGFIAVFVLVFGAGLTRRRSVVAALRALGASTVLPGGNLVGPAIGVGSANPDRTPLRPAVRSTIAFTVLTLAPGVVVLGFFGVSLWLGWPAGPHDALLTLPAAGVAATLLVGWFLVGRPAGPAISPQGRPPVPLRWADGRHLLRQGAAEAGHVLATRNWKLLGTVAYYAFDNAVLWAAFRAYGHAPPIAAIVMGYLVGSLSSIIPIPAGLGAVEGGLIGALVLYGAPAAPTAGAVLLYRGISLGLAVTLSAGAWVLGRPSRGADGRTGWAGGVPPADATAQIRRAYTRRPAQQRAARREHPDPVAP